MKLYLSSYQIPTPDDLATLLGKPLAQTSAALIANAKDYYADRARKFKVDTLMVYMQTLDLQADEIDLRNFDDPSALKQKLASYDLIWVAGGNTYVLRDEMQRSGFDAVIKDLLDGGIVYGGESAGALVAGPLINGVELADEPAFAEKVINQGLSLIPYMILPHTDNANFAAIMPVFRDIHIDKNVIELKDSQAVIFDGDEHRIVTATS